MLGDRVGVALLEVDEEVPDDADEDEEGEEVAATKGEREAGSWLTRRLLGEGTCGTGVVVVVVVVGVDVVALGS